MMECSCMLPNPRMVLHVCYSIVSSWKQWTEGEYIRMLLCAIVFCCNGSDGLREMYVHQCMVLYGIVWHFMVLYCVV